MILLAYCIGGGLQKGKRDNVKGLEAQCCKMGEHFHLMIRTNRLQILLYKKQAVSRGHVANTLYRVAGCKYYCYALNIKIEKVYIKVNKKKWY